MKIFIFFQKTISLIVTAFSVLLATSLIMFLQVFIYYGAKYELYPRVWADKFHVKWIEEGGYNPFDSSWEIPWYFELPLFAVVFLLIKFLLSKVTRQQNVWKLRYAFFLLFFYIVCLSQSSFGRDLFLTWFPEKIDKTIEINCKKNVITIEGKVLKSNPSFCIYCPSNEKNCVFKGLKEPRFNKPVFRWFSKS